MTSSDDMLYCYLLDIVSHLQPLSHRCQLSFNHKNFVKTSYWYNAIKYSKIHPPCTVIPPKLHTCDTFSTTTHSSHWWTAGPAVRLAGIPQSQWAVSIPAHGSQAVVTTTVPLWPRLNAIRLSFNQIRRPFDCNSASNNASHQSNRVLCPVFIIFHVLAYLAIPCNVLCPP